VRLGLITPTRARNEALAYFGIALLLGVYLALTGSPWLLVIGALGLGMALLYTAPGVFLVGAGLGEVAIFLCFGPLFVLGVWMALTGTFSWEPVWASFPAGFLITNVIWINQFPDMPADAAVGKRHWVVRLGRKRSAYIYGGLFLATYLSLLLGMWVGGLPVWSGLGLLTIPLAWKAWRVSRAAYDRMQDLGAANALTIQIHLLTGILMTLGYLAARIFSQGL
jgi:1,4-dihydroxy-2-naphthoate octaprenyltransferase